MVEQHVSFSLIIWYVQMYWWQQTLNAWYEIAVKFEKPAPKSAVKLIAADNIDELINLLHNEAKVI